MGHMRHHAIIVTSGEEDLLRVAHAKASELGMTVTPITARVMNRYRSFLVAPDGSKEGWEDSNAGDARRAELVGWLAKPRYLHYPSGLLVELDWVEVQFGDDCWDTRVVHDSDEHRRGRRAIAGEDGLDEQEIDRNH
jgi:hypothetical protein